MAKRKIAAEDLAEKKKIFEKIADNLEVVPADKYLKDNFLPYAWSFALDRALVDVSGLKPVQRRILYTMYKENISPNTNRVKVASLGGMVLPYHPHGDASVVDSLKNLERPHIFRVPMIDGKGDFGVPGTPGAAGRYIEARLNKAAWLNVEELAEHAVPMVPNYDETREEPVRLPVKWPVAMINGGSGIAVGYAANIPSHNPSEVMDACRALVRNPEMTMKAFQKIVIGPDFNMGGTIVSTDGINDYMATGSGTFKIRGNYEVKPKARGAYRIEFYEIPFGTHPEKIIEEVQKAVGKGQLKELSVYKDLSDRKHPIRVVFETKTGSNYKKVLQDLFKITALESSFSVNLTTVVDNRPVAMPMRDLLLNFIEFRKYCIRNKSNYTLGKKSDRLHIVEGLKKVLLNIDKAIAIIRKSDTAEDASSALQKSFKIDKVQADFVLSLQLRRLTKMDNAELDNEKKSLNDEISYLKSLVEDEEVLKEHLLKEFLETKKVIGDERKTEILNVTAEEFVEQEKALTRTLKASDKDTPCYVTRFVDGKLLKTFESEVYPAEVKGLEHGGIIEQVKTSTKSEIVIVTDDGIGHKMAMDYLPLNEAVGKSQLGLSGSIVGISKTEMMKSDIGLAVATEKGEMKIAKTNFPNREEFPVITLSDGDKVVSTIWLSRAITDKSFFLVSQSGNIINFAADSVRISGSSAGGVVGMKFKKSGDKVVAFSVGKAKEITVASATAKTVKITSGAEIPQQGRGGFGVVLQSFRAGEPEALKQAVVGETPVATMKGTPNIVMLPPMSKRAARGAESIAVSLGLRSPLQA